MSKTERGFLVKSPCGREWFVPLAKVGQDYAYFLEQADGLTPAEAMATSVAKEEFWPTWFAEQCNLWVDIDRLGRLIKQSTLFKTKAALDRRRKPNGASSAISDYQEVEMPIPLTKEEYPALACPLCDAERKPARLNKDGSVTYSCPADHVHHGNRYTWRIAADGTLID